MRVVGRQAQRCGTVTNVKNFSPDPGGERVLVLQQLPKTVDGNQSTGFVQRELLVRVGPGRVRRVSPDASRTVDVLERGNQSHKVRIVYPVMQVLGFAAKRDQFRFPHSGQML